MALMKLILEVQEVAGCKIFAEGYQLAIDYPAVVLEESDGVCLNALNQCHPYLLALSRGVAFATLGIGQEEGTLKCSCPEGEVRFSARRHFRRLVVGPEIQAHLERLKLDMATLQAMPVFSPLPPPSLERVIPLLQLRRVRSGTAILRQDAVGKALFIIVKGEVAVVRRGEGGSEELLATLAPGECFGEMSLISGEPVSATIRATKPTTLLQLEKEDFDRLVLEHPSLNVYFTRLLTQRLRQANTRMVEVLDKGIVGNVKAFGLPELIQTLALNRRTGTLFITDGNRKGAVYFQEGAIYQATFNDLAGEEALYRLIGCSQGQFQFQGAETVPVIRKIQKDALQLLMEGLRRLDEEADPAKAGAESTLAGGE